jgi:hypothetical protein
MMNIRSPKTLRKHYRHELDCGALEANNEVAQTMYKMAASGKFQAATMFWLKCRERPVVDAQPKGVPSFVVALEDGVKWQ